MARFRLDRDVAVCAVEDTTGLKTPIVAFHALDRRFVLAGEGHACKSAALIERIRPNACHTVRYRHTCQSAAEAKHIIPDTCHAVRYRHTCQSAAEAKHTIPDTCHAVRYRHACQPCTIIKRIVPDARYIGSDFNCLRFFYPDRVTIS